MTDALEKKPQRTATFHVTLCPPPSCHPDSHPIQSLDTLRIFRRVGHLPTYQSNPIHSNSHNVHGNPKSIASQEHHIIPLPTMRIHSSLQHVTAICMVRPQKLETSYCLLSKIMLARTKPARSFKKDSSAPATELVVETAPALQGPSVAV